MRGCQYKNTFPKSKFNNGGNIDESLIRFKYANEDIEILDESSRGAMSITDTKHGLLDLSYNKETGIYEIYNQGNKLYEGDRKGVIEFVADSYVIEFNDGGDIEEGVNLFEDYENIPEEVQVILDKYQDAFEDGSYSGLAEAHKELEAIGYTFDYYLDGQAYDLRKIGQKGKVALEVEKLDSKNTAFKNGGMVTEEIITPKGRKFIYTKRNNIHHYIWENIPEEYLTVIGKGGASKTKLDDEALDNMADQITENYFEFKDEKYANGGSTRNWDKLEEGGSIDSVRRFTEDDFNKLTYLGNFSIYWSGYLWEIYPKGGGMVLGKFNPKTKTLFITRKKDLTNDLVKYLKENSYVSKEEYFKLEKGGGIGRNYEIELIENSSNARRWKGTVSTGIYNKIESLKNSGGFKRYEIDLYDDSSSVKPDNSGLYEFMNSIGIKWTSTLPTVDKNRVERTNWKNGGSIKSKYWIKKALSGGKNKGSLRKTAMRKGLLRNDNENLSMTDLHKLQKMGGKTAKRAYFAETLRKFNNGGGIGEKHKELKSIINNAKAQAKRDGYDYVVYENKNGIAFSRKSEFQRDWQENKKLAEVTSEGNVKYSNGGGVGDEEQPIKDSDGTIITIGDEVKLNDVSNLDVDVKIGDVLKMVGGEDDNIAYFTNTRTNQRIGVFADRTTKIYSNGGGVGFIGKPEHYRYLTLQKVKNGLLLILNEEGVEELNNITEDNITSKNPKSDTDIWIELFEDVQGNSEYIFHPDMGESGFGMTSAEGITDGYYYEGEDRSNLYKTDYPESAKIYWFPNYMVERSISTLINKGEVFFTEAKSMSNGGGIGNQNALMVMNDNKQIKHHTEELNKVVDINTEVPAWVVSKVHRSASDLSDATHYLDGVNSEFKNGGGVGYGEIKKEKEKMTTELFNKLGVFFAFSNEQFNQNKTPLKEGEKYVSIGAGGYIPKGNLDAFLEGMKSINQIGKNKVKENNLAETEILYELKNHESFYTGDYSDVVDMFKGTYTEKQIRDVYNKHRESNQDFDNGGGINSVFLGNLISVELAETFLGRKINSWKDDVIHIGDTMYKKVYLRPEYKRMTMTELSN